MISPQKTRWNPVRGHPSRTNVPVRNPPPRLLFSLYCKFFRRPSEYPPAIHKKRTAGANGNETNRRGCPRCRRRPLEPFRQALSRENRPLTEGISGETCGQRKVNNETYCRRKLSIENVTLPLLSIHSMSKKFKKSFVA